MPDRTPLISVTRKDLEIEFFRAGGKGGSNQNKTSTGARVRHKASGAVAECRETRSQLDNKRRAFFKMTQTVKFRAWLRRETALRSGLEAKIEESVQRGMRPSNLLVEVRVDGRWIAWEDSDGEEDASASASGGASQDAAGVDEGVGEEDRSQGSGAHHDHEEGR